MPISHELAAELAAAFITAEQRCEPIEPIRLRHPDLTEADVYQVQKTLVEQKVQGGERVIGWKAGATNAAAQANMGLDGPTFGHLFASGQVSETEPCERAALIHPRIECDGAFRSGRDLAGTNVTIDDVMAATEAILPAFEIVDPRTQGWQVGLCEMVADNVFAARYVLGQEYRPAIGLDLPSVTVVLHKNGEQVASATGANVLGNPAQAVAWLANKLAEYQLQIKAGDLVLAGSLTPLHPISAGDRFEAIFSDLGSVRVRFE